MTDKEQMDLAHRQFALGINMLANEIVNFMHGPFALAAKEFNAALGKLIDSANFQIKAGEFFSTKAPPFYVGKKQHSRRSRRAA